jgi:hypothetical protein
MELLTEGHWRKVEPIDQNILVKSNQSTRRLVTKIPGLLFLFTIPVTTHKYGSFYRKEVRMSTSNILTVVLTSNEDQFYD